MRKKLTITFLSASIPLAVGIANHEPTKRLVLDAVVALKAVVVLFL